MSSSLAIRSAFFRPWYERSSAARTASGSELEHIFVVAGPSGSGKSTFMSEFLKNRLPKTVSDGLPSEAKAWKRIGGNELGRKGLAKVLRKKGPSPGFVLHYDIMRAHTRGFEHYTNDPAMQAVTGAKATLTILTILPSREALFAQFLERARADEYEEWWDKRQLTRKFKRKLRAGFYKLIGQTPKLLKEGHLVLLNVYASDERLKHWTTRWENFLETVRHGRDDVRLVFIAPESTQDEYPRFRLLRSV
ncbi:MAG: hypothetical protein ACOYB4_06720 [Methyloceanibacter sp.]